MVIPKALYETVRQRAQSRCAYCHYPELLSSAPLSIDHIQPQSLGGSDDMDNLALACRRCNERRYNFTLGFDPESNLEVPLFNPRQQEWSDHFMWSADGLRVVGKTSTGRATCNRLDLNDERRQDSFIQNARQQWIAGALHPPNDDPRQQNLEEL